MEADKHGSDRLTPPRRRRLQLLAMGLVLLCSGIIIGASGAIFAVRHIALTVVQDPYAVPAFLERRFTRALNLDDTQQAKVEAILEKHHLLLLDLRRENRPRIDALIESLNADVRAILTEEQQTEWQERFEGFRNNWQPRLPEES